jgi:two-component system response regulator GlrR
MIDACILVLDFGPESTLADCLRTILESSPLLSVHLWRPPQQALKHEGGDGEFPSLNPSLVFVILPEGMANPSDVLARVKRKYLRGTPYIVVCERQPSEEIYLALSLGVSDYVVPPLRAPDILPRVWRLVGKPGFETPAVLTREETIGLSDLIGESKPFVAAVSKIPVVAKCDASILILGETGTGKEVLARAIHYLSTRSRKPFIPVNCGALPLELVENELFGHERGAYTNASTSRFGLIHEAEGGTLFLDEVDCLPTKAQVKLLRFLQNREYRQIGSAKNWKADVRIIAATNIDVESAVNEGRFRRDLYYRLNVIPLVLPPLRERHQDILLLAHHFLTKYTAEFGRPARRFSFEAIQELMSYDWPGNVRELEHIVERAVVFSDQPVIQREDLFLPNRAAAPQFEPFQKAKDRAIEQFEKAYLERLLVTFQGNITKAAGAAHKHRRAFWQLVRKHNLDVNSLRLSHKVVGQ